MIRPASEVKNLQVSSRFLIYFGITHASHSLHYLSLSGVTSVLLDLGPMLESLPSMRSNPNETATRTRETPKLSSSLAYHKVTPNCGDEAKVASKAWGHFQTTSNAKPCGKRQIVVMLLGPIRERKERVQKEQDKTRRRGRRDSDRSAAGSRANPGLRCVSRNDITPSISHSPSLVFPTSPLARLELQVIVPREDAVREYSGWHQPQIDTEEQKKHYDTA